MRAGAPQMQRQQQGRSGAMEIDSSRNLCCGVGISCGCVAVCCRVMHVCPCHMCVRMCMLAFCADTMHTFTSTCRRSSNPLDTQGQTYHFTPLMHSRHAQCRSALAAEVVCACTTPATLRPVCVVTFLCNSWPSPVFSLLYDSLLRSE